MTPALSLALAARVTSGAKGGQCLRNALTRIPSLPQGTAIPYMIWIRVEDVSVISVQIESNKPPARNLGPMDSLVRDSLLASSVRIAVRPAEFHERFFLYQAVGICWDSVVRNEANRIISSPNFTSAFRPVRKRDLLSSIPLRAFDSTQCGELDLCQAGFQARADDGRTGLR